MDQTDCELKWISIHVKGIAPVYIEAFYRSQKTDNDYMRLLESSIEKIPGHASIWLLGDFNLPDVDWASNSFLPGGRYAGPSKIMIDIAHDHNLHQAVIQPTREQSILDLCFTNNPGFICRTNVKAGISDHDFVTVEATIKPKIFKKPKRKIFIYAKAHYSNISKDLNELNCRLTGDVYENSNDDEMWTIFTHTMLKSMDKNIPHKTSSSKSSLPWVNASIKRSIRKKRKLYNRARQTGDFYLRG